MPRRSDRTGRLRPLVAASIGSYGASLADGSEYRGDFDLSKPALKEWHRPRLEALLAANPDLLACETIPCLREGEALVELLGEYGRTPAWLSFSCRDAAHVSHGEPFATCVALADSCPAIVAIGMNCTSPRYVLPLLQSARTITGKPLVCYPNSGERWDITAKCWAADSEPKEFAAQATLWRAAGAQLIGGCCRTSPMDIRDMRSLLLGDHVETS